MKLFRFGEKGFEKPGVIINNGNKIDVSEFSSDYDQIFFRNNGLDKLSKWLDNNSSKCSIVDNNMRLGVPIVNPSKIICVGLNYEKHAIEGNMEIPKEPILFFKSTTAINGPYDNIIIPKGSVKTDWEVELAIIIGKKASYIKKEDSLDYIAGYVLHNDVSEREFQLEMSGQWVKGKSCDSFAPLGPYIVSTDEIKDPNNLDLWLKVNGTLMQNSNTSDFIFNIQHVVSYISQFMTLLPGDIISTGTPQGVGMGLNPPKYLKEGDIVELGIDGLGVSKQTCINYR
ncbi:MAG: fumarylacetoacetate hydrolase family protein [Flavobacteriaceae bacterium]|jgi:2-keto-4-pentenoate hydratase/2-oxohepta-3-ene-1,7-dioic acid hydratase in catechol pathway